MVARCSPDLRQTLPTEMTTLRLATLRLERLATGTRLDYTADIRLGGILRLVEPFLGGAFANIGRNAADGMKRTLEAQATAARQGRDHGSHDGRDAA